VRTARYELPRDYRYGYIKHENSKWWYFILSISSLFLSLNLASPSMCAE
jgi:hypothetical protein